MLSRYIGKDKGTNESSPLLSKTSLDGVGQIPQALLSDVKCQRVDDIVEEEVDNVPEGSSLLRDPAKQVPAAADSILAYGTDPPSAPPTQADRPATIGIAYASNTTVLPGGPPQTTEATGPLKSRSRRG
jgi:hypothetical protein